NGRAGMFVVPFGVGLFASSASDDEGNMHVAYYDQAHGNLVYAKLSVENGALTLSSGPTIIDGEADGESTGDVGRWTDLHLLDDGGVVIFYEDSGKAQLRAAVIQGNSVDVTVLDEGVYTNHNEDKVSTNRVGSNPVAKPLAPRGFEVFYHDATHVVARHLVWDDLSEAPTEHPVAILGSPEGYARDPAE